MTPSTNEACMGWFYENCYLMGWNDAFDTGGSKFIKGHFSGGEMSKLLAAVWFSPPISRVSGKCFGEGRTVQTRLGQQNNIKGGNIFGQKGDTGGIIPGDNTARNCLVLGRLSSVELLE